MPAVIGEDPIHLPMCMAITEVTEPTFPPTTVQAETAIITTTGPSGATSILTPESRALRTAGS